MLHTGDFKMDQFRSTVESPISTHSRASAMTVSTSSWWTPRMPKSAASSRANRTSRPYSMRSLPAPRAPGGCVFRLHIHRVQQVINAAVTHGRKVAFVGRSMVRTMNVARDLGYLKVPGGLTVTLDQLDELPDDEVVLICTGSQGEPMAVLARIANRDHKIRVHEQDTVVLASSVIPGNENLINRVINGLSRWGHRRTPGNALVHVSGHAAAGELLYAYNIVKPNNVMPVHGETGTCWPTLTWL